MIDLRTLLDEYLATRRALGVRLEATERLLERFVAYVSQREAPLVTTELALRWATEPSHAQPAQWAKRLGLVRGFARYANAVDPRHQVPPQGLIAQRYRRPRPYIYSDREIADLIAAARTLSGTTGLRPFTYATLLALLSVTGMRTGEILNLDRDDVDFANGVLTVRDGKFGKNVDRIVMLSGARMSLSTKDMEPRSLNITMMHSPHHHRRGGESHHAFKATAPYTRGSTRRPIPINDFAVCRVSAPCGPFRVQHRRLSRAGSALPDLVGRGGHRSRFGGRRRGTAISESRLHVSADGLYGQIYSFLAVRSLRGPDCMVCQIP